jgi:AraC family transcriptional regulator
VNAELIRLRVEHYKRLIASSDAPLEELALQAGFGTAKHVYRTFKRLTGQTPAEYREERRVRPWSGFTGRRRGEEVTG